MNPTLRRLTAVLLCGLLPALPARAQELVLAVPAIGPALPLLVAEAQGLYAAAGLQVRLQDCTTSQRCLDQVFSGAAHAAGVAELSIVFNSFERADFASFAAISSAVGNLRILARRSAGIETAAQLEGKRVGVVIGSGAQYYLDAHLLFHGIDPKRLRMVALQPQELAPALVARRIDALAGYSLYALPAAQALGADVVRLDDPRLYTETFHLVAGQAVLAQRRGDLARLLGVLARAQQFIAAQPQAARRIMQARMRLDAATAEALFPLFTYRLGLDQSVVGSLDGQARWALREGHVRPDRVAPNYLRFIDAGPLREGLPLALPR